MSAGNRQKLEEILGHVFGGRSLGPELLDADAEWVNPPDAVEGGTRRGFDAFNDAIAVVFATWDDVHFDAGNEAIAFRREMERELSPA